MQQLLRACAHIGFLGAALTPTGQVKNGAPNGGYLRLGGPAPVTERDLILCRLTPGGLGAQADVGFIPLSLRRLCGSAYDAERPMAFIAALLTCAASGGDAALVHVPADPAGKWSARRKRISRASRAV
jgi:hypothetical protein